MDEQVEPDGKIYHHCQLPDGSIPVAVVEVVQFLNPDGQMESMVRWDGRSNPPEQLGMLEYAKFQIWDAHHGKSTP